MIAAYVVGGILVWAVIAFGLAALFRGTATRNDAQGVAWITGFWPVTVPFIAAFALILGVVCGLVWLLENGSEGIGKVGARYIDFIHGEKRPSPPPNLNEKLTATQQAILDLEKKMRADGWKV